MTAVRVGTVAALALVLAVALGSTVGLGTAHAQNPGYCNRPRAIRFAVIGDYGVCAISKDGCEAEAIIAKTIKDINPDFVVTVGDNNYHHGEAGPNLYPPPSGSAGAHIRQNNLRVFKGTDFNPDYTGDPPSPPDPVNGVELYESFINNGRFFMALGNHDYHQLNAQPAKDLLNPDQHHQLSAGLVDLFIIDSNEASMNGEDDDDAAIDASSEPTIAQERDWAYPLVRDSVACWQQLYFHHPPYSRSNDHPTNDLRIGPMIEQVYSMSNNKLDAALYGHQHFAEQLTRTFSPQLPQLRYFLSGGGGARLYPYLNPLLPPGTVVDYKEPNLHSFLYVTAEEMKITYQWYTVEKKFLDAPTWWQRWEVKTPPPTIVPNPACMTGLLTCSVAGNCSVSIPPLPPLPACVPVGQTCGGMNRIEVPTPQRFTCPAENGVFDAVVRVRVCCDAGMISQCYSQYCPIVANAYDCKGNLIDSICLYPSTEPDVYRGQSGCRFDRWSAPCKWVIYNWNSNLKLCNGSVDYVCCTNCSRSYGWTQQ